MIPDREQVRRLWDKYDLPVAKRQHSELVSKTSLFLARKLEKKGINLNFVLLEAAALLHDIDKNIPKLPGENHPDAGVRILKKEGMEEVAELVRRHPLHAILNPSLTPDTWEAKILYLADKTVKNEIIGVDRRFGLWQGENLGKPARQILSQAYPLAKKLEAEIFGIIGFIPDELANLLNPSYTPHAGDKKEELV